MPRAPFQVLVYLYRYNPAGGREYALFERADAHFWQGVAGGGENAESPLEAAIRETREEAGLDLREGWLCLDTIASIPVTEFKDHVLWWGEERHVIPQHCFGVPAAEAEVRLSHEHCAVLWLPYEQALPHLRFDSDRTALWELECRLSRPPHKVVQKEI